MSQLRGFDQFKSAVKQWVAEVDDLTVGVARGISVKLFNNLLEISPQFSGDFVANWKYSVGSVNTAFEPVMGDERIDLTGMFDPYYPGHPRAINWAKSMNRGEDRNFVEVGQTIYISNSAVHIGKDGVPDHYAMKIENNQIKFRFPNTGEVVRQSVEAISSQYGVSINRIEALMLNKLRLGA